MASISALNNTVLPEAFGQMASVVPLRHAEAHVGQHAQRAEPDRQAVDLEDGRDRRVGARQESVMLPLTVDGAAPKRPIVDLLT